jgi:hypothetical protein
MFDDIAKRYITYIFIVIIFIYHSIQIISPNIIQKDIGAIINLVEWITLSLFAFISFDLKFIHKLILRSDYIAGVYVGQSYYLTNDGKVDKKKEGREIEFIIEQTLTKIELTGHSSTNDSEDGFDTNWKGYFYKKDRSDYFFALEVEYGKKELGNMQLIFDKNLKGECIGFYYSGDSTSLNQKITFKKKGL